jgi:hypothetical protein
MKKRTNTVVTPYVTIFERLLIVLFALAILSGLTSCSKDAPAPTPTVLPSTVSGLTVIAQDGKDSLTWSANYSDENIKTYNVYAGTSATNMSVVGSTTKNGFLHTGLTNGTTYYYAVSAVNAKGEGPKSSTQSVTPNTALNKQFTMFIPQVLPGALKAAPWRYWDPKELYYSDNPFVLTDTFKYIVNADIYEGFDTTIYQESLNLPGPPAKYVLINKYRIGNLGLANPTKKLLQQLDKISEWNTGVFSNLIDTIPVSFYLQGDISKAQILNVISNVRIKAYGTRISNNEYAIDKTYTIDQFTIHSQLEVWDKITPSIFPTNKGWLVVIPATGSLIGKSAGTQLSILGYQGICLQVNYKDLSKNAQTIY